MSDAIDRLAEDLYKALKESDNFVPKPMDTSAEVVRVEPSRVWVRFAGSDIETPISKTISAREGDIVQVRVSDKRAWITGNATNPPTDDRIASEALLISRDTAGSFSEFRNSYVVDSNIINSEIVDLKAFNAEISNVVARDSEIIESHIEKFNVVDGVIQDLQADNATIHGTLTAESARIDDLEADHVSTTDLQAATARIGDLEADHVSTTDLQATNAQISNLESTKASISYLEANYAEIDLANVNNAWIQNGVIKDAAISDAQIIGVSANKLTAGTIDASDITVTNLNANNITTGTINGQRIGTGSLSLDKLAEEVPTKDYLDNVAENLQGQIDGQIETWTGTVVPTLQNYPAVNWENTSERHKHVGDIYYVVNASSESSEVDGYTYRFTESGASPNYTYSWTLIKDNQVTKALQDILDMQGDISGIKTFDSQISSWKTSTDSEISSLKSRTSTLETDMGTKVSTTTFNELSQTVDENSAAITSLGEIVNVVYVPTTDTAIDPSKTYYIYSGDQYVPVENPVAADLGSYFEKSTTQEVSNTVNTVKQTATSLGTTISQLTTTLGTNADGTTKNDDVMHRTSALEQDLSTFKTAVSNTYATKTYADDLITTEVGNRNSAITQSANSVLTTVSETYSTIVETNNLIEQEVLDREAAIEASAGNIQLAISESETNTRSYADGKVDSLSNSVDAEINALDQDLSGQIGAVSERVTAADARIDMKITRATDTDDLVSNINAVADQITLLASQINFGNRTVESALNDEGSRLDLLDTAISIDTSVPSIRIGSKSNANSMYLMIMNDRLGFYKGENEVAYMSGDNLYINDSEILNNLRIGQFKWRVRTDSNGENKGDRVSFRYDPKATS